MESVRIAGWHHRFPSSAFSDTISISVWTCSRLPAGLPRPHLFPGPELLGHIRLYDPYVFHKKGQRRIQAPDFIIHTGGDACRIAGSSRSNGVSVENVSASFSRMRP